MTDKEDSSCVGPYKATKVWNDVIAAFRQYLPCGRHRRYMKTFEECFSGSEAIEWLLEYLKTNASFSSDITRLKAVALVNKLYHAGIFEEVPVSKNMRHKTEVQENRLYKFLPASPSKMKTIRLPLKPRNDGGFHQDSLVFKAKDMTNSSRKKDKSRDGSKDRGTSSKHVEGNENAKGMKSVVRNLDGCDNAAKSEEQSRPSRLSRKISMLKKERAKKDKYEETENTDDKIYPPCHIVTRILTTKEIKATWKAVFINRLKKVLVGNPLEEIVPMDCIDGYNVMHNCIYLNKSGIVTNIDATEQLPHWVMSAMKCLAHWPEPVEPGLPNYPGFEKDVFSVVRDYFMSLDEPLVPYHLYDTFTSVFVMHRKEEPKYVSPTTEADSYEFLASSNSRLCTTASLENLILNLTKKYFTVDSTSHYQGSSEDLLSLRGPNQTDQLPSYCASQEDLRFSNQWDGHFNGYNGRVFPSTDGIDKMHRSKTVSVHGSLGNITSRKSCPLLPGLKKDGDFLSKSTQSARNSRLHRNRGFSGRLYGSTPNLKVSKYETAFGPDNRTVTRVFYQSGLTADISHDEEENDVFLPIDQPHNVLTESNRCSLICGSDADRQQENGEPLKRPLAKSYSEIGLGSGLSHAKSESLHFTDGSNNWRSRSKHFITHNQEDELIPPIPPKRTSSLSHKTTVPFKEDYEIGAARKLSQQHSRQIVSSTNDGQNHSSNLLRTVSSGSLEVNRASKVLSQPLSAPCSTQAFMSVVTAPTIFYPTEERLTPTRKCSQSQLLTEMYGPGYRLSTTKHASSFTNGSSPLLSQSQTMRNHNDSFYSQRDIMFAQGDEGYRPILDASKERRSLNLSHASPQDKHPILNNQTHPRNSCGGNSLLTSTPMSSLYTGSLPHLGIESCLPPQITPYHRNASHRSPRQWHSNQYVNFPQTGLSEERTRSALQVVSLLLPPSNRRKLHLLLKLMAKMTANPDLVLDLTQTNRSLVLTTFYKTILGSAETREEMIDLQLVSFMLDFFNEIFTPPENIKTQVSDRLKTLQKPQVVYSPQPVRTVRFCQQVSTADFENQRNTDSQKSALEELLENIVRDENMAPKEKKRRLRQFQRTYPAIYSRRFPNADVEASAVPPSKPKIKEPFVVKPLHKLKGLRL